MALPDSGDQRKLVHTATAAWWQACEFAILPDHRRIRSTAALVNPYVSTTVLLILSNVFMTFAWYGHLKNLSGRPWIVAALVSWGIALFEYLLQVPANRIGHGVMNLGQLKILQEVITLSVFVPFAILYMKEKLTLDYLWAGICLLGAVFFLFRAKLVA